MPAGGKLSCLQNVLGLLIDCTSVTAGGYGGAHAGIHHARPGVMGSHSASDVNVQADHHNLDHENLASGGTFMIFHG
jgi:hypothetical protein